MKKKMPFFLYGLIVGVVLPFLLGTTTNSPEEEKNFPQGYKIISPTVPEELDFCGEPVPLKNFEVYERMDREFVVNTYFHSSTILSMKKANRWFPVVEPILEVNGIPDDMKYLMIAESGIANLISYAGATGYWQFMEEAALKYGLEVNDEVDERYHMEKATDAACKYLNEAYGLFGSWTMAAASYNTGIENIQKQIERQKAKNYYNLVLSEETLRYIARIVAIKEVMNHPEKYGFDIKQKDLYNPLPYKLVQVSGPVGDLADFAIGQGINYRILKLYNPWLRDNVLTNRGMKTYSIKIPEKGSIDIIEE
jgi:membrane-bound lytic murein transglycosylase D